MDYRGQPIITFTNVSKKFGEKAILSNIYLSIYEGEIFGLMGQSGAGKTTLLRLLIGYLRSDSGTIHYKNSEISKNTDLIKTIFGFSSSGNCFYHELTLLENLSYFGKLYSLPNDVIRTRSEEALKLVELWDDRKKVAKDLSTGMQRRFDLACSLMHAPQILILDEPTEGLDPLTTKHVWTFIKRLSETGITIIFSSHRLEEMEHVCDRVSMLHHKRIIVCGTPDELKKHYAMNEEITLETYPANYPHIMSALQRLGVPISYVRYENHKVVFYTPRAQVALQVIFNLLAHWNTKIIDVDIQKPNLSEVFEALSKVT